MASSSFGLNCTLGTALFVENNNKPGYSTLSISEHTTVHSMDKLELIISEVLTGNIKLVGTGTYSGSKGSIYFSCLSSCSEGLFIDATILAEPHTAQVLKYALESNEFHEDRKEGVYEVCIDHWYLDKTNSPSGEMKNTTYYRDTNDFSKLLPEMYPRIDIKEMMRQFSVSDECIMIMSGQPGTGKTCFAKMMMSAHATTQQEDMRVVYVKDRELLRKDHFWAMMGRQEPDIIILDDLDNELLPRGTEGNEIVSNMLSYSDGIFDVDTKIIITTNLTDSRIDKALVRPGRSFDTLCLPQLSREEALTIWTDTLEAPVAEFDGRFSGMDTISQAALISEHQRLLKSNSPSYLLDPNISVRKLVEEGATIE